MATVTRLPIHCKSKACNRWLGDIRPAEAYGRLYLLCKCKRWWPAVPPHDDPELTPIRCQRNELQAFNRKLTGQDSPCGGFLGLIALKPNAQLVACCQKQHHLSTNFWMTSTGLLVTPWDDRATPAQPFSSTGTV